jgi:hypothetical protein
MILTKVQNDLFHVGVAKLKQANGNPIRFFGNGGQVIVYLKAHPDTAFLLEPVNIGMQLQGAIAGQYGPANGDVFCGQVKFDTNSNSVICT